MKYLEGKRVEVFKHVFNKETKKFQCNGVDLSSEEANDLFLVRKVYADAKLNKEFQKRWLYFLQTPNAYKDAEKRVFIQYHGEDKNLRSVHGNSKTNTQMQRQTDACIMKEMEDALLNRQKNPEIMDNLDNPDTPESTIYKSQQITSMRYYLNHRGEESNNEMDQIQRIHSDLMNGVKTRNYVQKITHRLRDLKKKKSVSNKFPRKTKTGDFWDMK